MTDINSDAIAQAINSYCFEHIWNDPYSEYRVNIKPYARNKGRSCAGFCSEGSSQIPLPTSSGSYFLFAFSLEVVRGALNIPNKKWVDSATICNDYDVLIHVYTSKGWMLSKKNCLFYIDRKHNSITLAVPKAAFKVLPEDDKEIYITIYVDSDDINNTTVMSISGTSATAAYILDVIRNIGSNKHQLTAFLNGCNYDPAVIESKYVSGNSLDLIIDENVLCEIDIPFVSEPHTFYSTRDKLYKEIIHIPKELNPNRTIITFNTCSMYVRDTTTRGAYVHLTSTDTVGQITFNDISIPSYILDAYSDYLDKEILTLHVKVKTHRNNNHMLRDSNYVDIMYMTQTDAQIVEHLLGNLDDNLTFWTADHLEQSVFTQFLFDTPNFATASDIPTFIDALGYYHVVSLICRRVITTTITDIFRGTLSFNKPYIWKDIDIYPIVYLNGEKIHDDYVSYCNYSNGTISIGTKSPISPGIGDELAVCFFPKGQPNIYAFTPTTDSTTITIPNDIDFTIYEELDNGTALFHGLYTSTQYSYKEREIEVGNIISNSNGDGTVTITFDSQNFGKTFIFQYNKATYTFQKDLTDDITEGKAFVIDLMHDVTNVTGKEVPILTCNDAYVYFNGKYLVKDVDYRLVFSDTLTGAICLTQIVVQNMSYGLDTDINKLEVVLSTIDVTHCDDGFVLDDIASIDLDVDIWFPTLCTVHVDGLFESDITSTGIGMQLPTGKYRNGAIFELKISVPPTVVDILLPNTDATDKDRITKIETYLYGTSVEEDRTIILTRSHKIYSVYMNFLVMGILNGTINVSYDPVTNNMLTQLTNYEYVKKFDSVFRTDGNPIDLKFVDVYPAYKELTVPDLATRKLLTALTNLILNKDEYTSGVIVRW